MIHETSIVDCASVYYEVRKISFPVKFELMKISNRERATCVLDGSSYDLLFHLITRVNFFPSQISTKRIVEKFPLWSANELINDKYIYIQCDLRRRYQTKYQIRSRHTLVPSPSRTETNCCSAVRSKVKIVVCRMNDGGPIGQVLTRRYGVLSAPDTRIDWPPEYPSEYY